MAFGLLLAETDLIDWTLKWVFKGDLFNKVRYYKANLNHILTWPIEILRQITLIKCQEPKEFNFPLRIRSVTIPIK